VLRVCDAMTLAHSQHIIHRDIKPANIVLDELGQPKLTDFDLVRVPDTTGGTRTGAIGTFVYTAPEVMERPMDASTASDVYSLAMTFLFGLHGTDLPTDVLRDPGEVLSSQFVADSVKAEIVRALDWDPWRRHKDAGELGRALAEAMLQAGGPDMVASRYDYMADDPIHPPLFLSPHDVPDPPPGLSSRVEYKRYHNSRFGFSADVPTFLTAQPGPANGDGRGFNYRKVVSITISGMFQWDDDATIQALREEAIARDMKDGAERLDGSAMGNSFTMKTRRGDSTTWQTTTLDNGIMSGAFFSYPTAQDAYFDPIARRVLASFRPPDRPDPRKA
jgi:serine/threonine protein kinase